MDKRLVQVLCWAAALALLAMWYAQATPARAAGDMPPPASIDKAPALGEPIGEAPDLPPGVPIPPPGAAYCYGTAGLCVSRFEEWHRNQQLMAMAGNALERLFNENRKLKEGCKPGAREVLRNMPTRKGSKT